MILIKLLGIDCYLAEEFVKDVHKSVADIFETNEDEIVFYAPDSLLINKGIEQTSYQLFIEVEAPSKYASLEAAIASLLSKLVLDKICVHVRILFKYFDEKHEYNYVNPSYPRFMRPNNIASLEQEDSEEEPYMGNAFEDYDQKVQQKEAEQVKEERERLDKKKNF